MQRSTEDWLRTGYGLVIAFFTAVFGWLHFFYVPKCQAIPKGALNNGGLASERENATSKVRFIY